MATLFKDLKATESDAVKGADQIQQENTRDENKQKNFQDSISRSITSFDGEKTKLDEEYSVELRLVSSEEKAAQLKEKYQQKEREAYEQHLLSLKMMYEAYGQDTTKIDSDSADVRLANAEREAQGKIAWTNAKAAIDSAYYDLAQQGTQALMGLVDQQSVAYKGLLLMDKAITISKIIMSTQTEIAGYYAANAALGPIGMGIATAQAAAAKVRAGISIGIVAAQGIGELIASSKGSGDAHADGVRNASPGKKLVGEAGDEIIEKDGKWWLTDGPQIVNFTGGENVYNANETKRILADRMYQKTNYTLNTTGARNAEMNYRSNGTALASRSNNSSTSSSTNPNDRNFDKLEAMIADLANVVYAESQKPIVNDYYVKAQFEKKMSYSFNSQKA